MNLRRYSAVVWVVGGVLLVLSLPAMGRGDIGDHAKELSLFDLSIVELMNVEISVPVAVMQQSDSPHCKPLDEKSSVSEASVQAASSQEAAEPAIPSLPVRQPAKSDVE
jgi:hypothetical protein